MKEVYKELVAQSQSADAEFDSRIGAELAKFDELMK